MKIILEDLDSSKPEDTIRQIYAALGCLYPWSREVMLGALILTHGGEPPNEERLTLLDTDDRDIYDLLTAAHNAIHDYTERQRAWWEARAAEHQASVQQPGDRNRHPQETEP